MDLAKRAYVMRRLDRRERWVSLWLTRIVAFLSAFETIALARPLHAWLTHLIGLLSDGAIDLIAMRATWSPAYRRRVALRRDAGCAVTISGERRRRATLRGVKGGALRRALKAKSLKGRAEALLRVLNNRNLWTGYMTRRLARGQTRFYSAHSRVAQTLPLHQPSLTLGWSPSPSKLGEELGVARAPP